MGTENRESCLQRDSAEREGYVGAHRSFRRIWKERDSAQPEFLEKILDKDNLKRTFKRVKANRGAPGIDEVKAESPQFPKVCLENTSCISKDKRVYAGLAELLWDCGNEETDRGTKFVAIPQNPHVYMKTFPLCRLKISPFIFPFIFPICRTGGLTFPPMPYIIYKL